MNAGSDAQVNAAGEAAQVEKVSHQTATALLATFASHPHPITIKQHDLRITES